MKLTRHASNCGKHSYKNNTSSADLFNSFKFRIISIPFTEKLDPAISKSDIAYNFYYIDIQSLKFEDLILVYCLLVCKPLPTSTDPSQVFPSALLPLCIWARQKSD